VRLTPAQINAITQAVSRLAAINERFAKLQGTLGVAMRHASLLAGERGDALLKVLAFYEKVGVLDSVAAWQLCRTQKVSL